VAGRAAAAATPSERLPERADPRAEPYARVRGHELARGLARAMAELPPTYREAARRDLSGESPSATAAALGLRPVTARVRAHRARKMLVERMSDLDLAA
jgi:DNA-directed RNA polymerase specialized sigma24 family protein